MCEDVYVCACERKGDNEGRLDRSGQHRSDDQNFNAARTKEATHRREGESLRDERNKERNRGKSLLDEREKQEKKRKSRKSRKKKTKP